MKKSIFLFFFLIVVLLPFSRVLADVSGNIETEQNHPLLTDGEISEKEWDRGEHGDGMEDINDPGADIDEPSLGEKIADGIKNLWDGTTDAIGAGIDAVGDVAKNLWDAGVEWGKNRLDDLKSLGESIWEGIKSIGEWFGSLSDKMQDLLWTILAVVVALGLLALALVAGLALSLGVIALVVLGIFAAATAYFLLFGGTDQFSFWGALTWAITGGIASGIMATTGVYAMLLANLRLGAGLLFQGIRSSLSLLLTRASGLFAEKGLLGSLAFLAKSSWGKGIIIGNLVTLGGHVVNFITTGQLPTFGELALDLLFGTLTGSLAFVSVGKLFNAFKSLSFVEVLKWLEYNALAGGITNSIMQQISNGTSDFSDFVVGSVLGITFLAPDMFFEFKGITKDSIAVITEMIKKMVSDISNSIWGSGASPPPEVNYSNPPPKFNAITGDSLQNIESINLNSKPPSQFSDSEIDIIRNHLENIQNQKAN